MLDSWIIAALGAILPLIQERIIDMFPIWGSPFLISQKLTQQGYLLPVYPPSNSNLVNIFFLFQKYVIIKPCAFHVIFLILCFSLSIYNIPLKRIILIFRSGLYPIMHVCLSILAQLCCKIKLSSFWVHLNTIPTCVIIVNLSWPSMFQYTTTYHASGLIVVHVKPDFIDTATELWRYMVLSLLPS